VRAQLLDAARAEVAGLGGGRLQYWAPGGPDEEELTEDTGRAGLHLGRSLLRMAAPLPVPADRRGRPAAVRTRAFRPGNDEEAWLAVNNRAFANHPEQGGWDLGTLRAREEEPWFDPEGFLVYETGGALVASCWTKIHRELDPPAGEIYVISVDPQHAGGGLGRALTLAGLDWLASKGLRHAILYVEGTNDAAVGLYRSLGFEVAEVLRVFTGEIPAAEASVQPD
jgi:mycothiol synthase